MSVSDVVKRLERQGKTTVAIIRWAYDMKKGQPMQYVPLPKDIEWVQFEVAKAVITDMQIEQKQETPNYH